MPNTKDITFDRANILLVGDSGTRKTRFLGDCPTPFIFDFDAGTAAIRHKSIDYDIFKDLSMKPDGSRYDPTPKQSKEGFYRFGDAWFAMVKRINDIGISMDKGECPYLTIGLDSLTMMSEIALNAATWQQDKKIVHQGTYGAQIQYIKTVISQLTAWPIRVVATAHIQRDINDVMQRTEKLPLLTGKLAGLIGAFFDEVYYIEPHEKNETDAQGFLKYVVRTQGTAELKQAKSRWGVPDKTEFTYAALSKYYGSSPAPSIIGRPTLAK